MNLPVLFLFLQDEYVVWPVEIKSCVAYETQECAKEQLKDYLGVQKYHPSSKYYIRLRADDPSLHSLIGDVKNKKRSTLEMYQMLHHAYMYGVDSCMLLVGTDKSLLYVVEVNFPSSTIEAYHESLDTLFFKYYNFLYQSTFEESSFPCDRIQQALDLHNEGRKEGSQVTWHAFLTNYRLWRALNVEPDGRSIKFPLPPINRFIPSQNTEWNLSKHPSDTLTRLFDDCEESITIRSPQTVAVARYLSVLATAFHRSLQILGAKESLESYQTLDNFRAAANNRGSFKSSLMQLSTFVWAELEAVERQQRLPTMNPSNSRQVLQEVPQTPPRRATRKNIVAPTQAWNNKWESGFTPGKAVGRPGEVKKRQAEQHNQRREDCLGFVLCISPNERKRCDFCKTWTRFFCSGCSSWLCVQTGTTPMSDKKIKTIRERLKIPADVEIPHYNSLSYYHPITKKRSETKVLNSCFHIGHDKRFTAYFKNANSIHDFLYETEGDDKDEVDNNNN